MDHLICVDKSANSFVRLKAKHFFVRFYYRIFIQRNSAALRPLFVIFKIVGGERGFQHI